MQTSNSLSLLLNDPNVLRQLQNLQKLKQQEEKQSKLTEMRLQEEAFEKHLATVLKVMPNFNSSIFIFSKKMRYNLFLAIKYYQNKL